MPPIQTGGQDIETQVGAGVGSVATHVGAAVDTVNFSTFLFILNAGTATATGTLDVKVEMDDDPAFGTAVDVDGAVFTQVDKDNDETVYYGVIHKTTNTKRYLRASADVGTDTVDFSITCIKLDPVSTADGDALAFDVAGEPAA